MNSLRFCLRPLTLIRHPLWVNNEHRYSVRRLRFSPYASGVLAAASYDTTVTLWDCAGASSVSPDRVDEANVGVHGVRTIGDARSSSHGKVLGRGRAHTEFVVGVAFALFEPGSLATCSWDRRVCIWRCP